MYRAVTEVRRTLANTLVGRRILCGTRGGEDEEPHGLPYTANNEWHATTEPFHNVEAEERATEVDSTENNLHAMS